MREVRRLIYIYLYFYVKYDNSLWDTDYPIYPLNWKTHNECISHFSYVCGVVFEFKFGSPLCVNRVMDTRLSGLKKKIVREEKKTKTDKREEKNDKTTNYKKKNTPNPQKHYTIFQPSIHSVEWSCRVVESWGNQNEKTKKICLYVDLTDSVCVCPWWFFFV